MEFDRSEWLDAIHAHYDRRMVIPIHAASELLLGQSDAEKMARSIKRRGRKVKDAVMATTTAADVVDAVEELIALGYLEETFSASCPSIDHRDCESHAVLELRMP
jgi:ABC-type ATPase with predicted acetyltransferase domain